RHAVHRTTRRGKYYPTDLFFSHGVQQTHSSDDVRFNVLYGRLIRAFWQHGGYEVDDGIHTIQRPQQIVLALEISLHPFDSFTSAEGAKRLRPRTFKYANGPALLKQLLNNGSANKA